MTLKMTEKVFTFMCKEERGRNKGKNERQKEEEKGIRREIK